MGIYLGSRLSILLPFEDVAEDGTASAFSLAGVEYFVDITKPSGEKIPGAPVTVVDAAGGIVRWDAAAGDLDEVGPWTVRARADGYVSEPRAFYVDPIQEG